MTHFVVDNVCRFVTFLIQIEFRHHTGSVLSFFKLIVSPARLKFIKPNRSSYKARLENLVLVVVVRFVFFLLARECEIVA